MAEEAKRICNTLIGVGDKSARMKTTKGIYTMKRGDWSSLTTDFVATVAM